MAVETMSEMKLSSVVGGITDAVSITINQMVYDLKRNGYDPTVLSLGEAFFDIPLFDFSKTDIEKGYHYSDSQGIPKLRDKIAGYYGSHYGAEVDGATQLLITAGSKPAIYMAMLAAIEPGDEVLIHEPCWLSYPHQVSLCGGVAKFIPYDVEPEQFESHLGERTRMLIINNPNNPRGRLYTKQQLRTIYEVCRKRNIYVLVDEAYSDFVIDEPFCSMAEVVPGLDGVIIVNSLSKNMGMSGWRIGYVISSEPFIEALLKINQHLITCAPTVLLQYCERYFDDILSVTLPQVREVVDKRRRISKMMDELGFDRLGGETTFYFFVSIGDFPGTSTDFAMHLLLTKLISVVPGSAYGASTDRFVRVSIGTESEERIWEALQVMKTLADDRDFKPYDYTSAMKGLNLHN